LATVSALPEFHTAAQAAFNESINASLFTTAVLVVQPRAATSSPNRKKKENVFS